MIDFLNKKKECMGCAACYSICPQQCITMKADNEGFYYPIVDEVRCNNCGMCEKSCPLQHYIEEKTQRTYKGHAYAAYNTDETIRLQSSSGGIFSLFAQEILKKRNGIVFGAAFSSDYQSVWHKAINEEKEIPSLRGSKYVQSNIGECYKEVKSYLEKGNAVFFSGTPCQIAGLKSYLGKEYIGLYTQDIVCHGVPSPLVWEKYVRYREQEAKSSVKNIFFRYKKYGWKMFSVLFEFSSDKKYTKSQKEDLYMRGFHNNIFLRPSCYNCSFKGLEREADITLADFWGIQTLIPEMDDDKGISFVLVNSQKGQTLFNLISNKVCYKETELEPAMTIYNTAAIKSVTKPPNRKNFMKDLQQQNIEVVLKKYCQISTLRKLKVKLRLILLRLKVI